MPDIADEVAENVNVWLAAAEAVVALDKPKAVPFILATYVLAPIKALGVINIPTEIFGFAAKSVSVYAPAVIAVVFVCCVVPTLIPPVKTPKPSVAPVVEMVAVCDNVNAVPLIADTKVLAGIPEP